MEPGTTVGVIGETPSVGGGLSADTCLTHSRSTTSPVMVSPRFVWCETNTTLVGRQGEEQERGTGAAGRTRAEGRDQESSGS